MDVYSRRSLIKGKLINFLKYEVKPYLFLTNKISKFITKKPFMHLDKEDVIFDSSWRVVERLCEAILSSYFNPTLSLALLSEGLGSYTALLGYDSIKNRKKSV